ncbi:MAG: ROK family protein [Xanthobacteraceae bacterium]
MRIGVDLGGTKIEAVALDDGGAELWRRRVATPVGDYNGTLAAIADLVHKAEQQLSRRGTVGIGTPGAISAVTGMIKNSNSTCLIGRPLDSDLGELLHRPIRIENDANCFALSEATDGAGRDGRVVFGVILGTGVGGGIVIDKRVVGGRNCIAGEWGHNTLPWIRQDEWPGAQCYCGKFGCIETYLCGAGLARQYQSMTQRGLSATDIAAAAHNGDRAALNSLSLYRDRLARSLASIINVLDPDIIVLGGGLSNIEALYAGLGDLILKFAFTDVLHTKIVRAVHGDSSGVRGAAWLWPEGEVPAARAAAR